MNVSPELGAHSLLSTVEPFSSLRMAMGFTMGFVLGGVRSYSFLAYGPVNLFQNLQLLELQNVQVCHGRYLWDLHPVRNSLHCSKHASCLRRHLCTGPTKKSKQLQRQLCSPCKSRKDMTVTYTIFGSCRLHDRVIVQPRPRFDC